MSSAKQSAEELIAALQKGEAMLDQIAHKLEEEAERRFSRAGEVRRCFLMAVEVKVCDVG